LKQSSKLKKVNPIKKCSNSYYKKQNLNIFSKTPLTIPFLYVISLSRKTSVSNTERVFKLIKLK
jgi:hypothetical protein